ncbi:MAG: response regulator transcription factor [Dongiaceae bacterium]
MQDRQTAKIWILLAVADERLRSALEYILLTSNYRVLGVGDGAALQAELRGATPDALVFDHRLPGLDAIAFCSALRLEKRTRDVVTLALGSDHQDLDGRAVLAAGADDFIARPFAPDRLLSRIHHFFKGVDPDALGAATCLSFADVNLDEATYRVRRNGQTIHLGLTEFRLLQHLMKNPHRVYSRVELQTAVWPPDAQIGLRTIDVHIGRLRCALRRVGGRDLIRTVRSVGYSLTD